MLLARVTVVSNLHTGHAAILSCPSSWRMRFFLCHASHGAPYFRRVFQSCGRSSISTGFAGKVDGEASKGGVGAPST